MNEPICEHCGGGPASEEHQRECEEDTVLYQQQARIADLQARLRDAQEREALMHEHHRGDKVCSDPDDSCWGCSLRAAAEREQGLRKMAEEFRAEFYPVFAEGQSPIAITVSGPDLKALWDKADAALAQEVDKPIAKGDNQAN